MNDWFHTYESYDLDVLQKFVEEQKPEVWFVETRINPDNLRTIYILRWF